MSRLRQIIKGSLSISITKETVLKLLAMDIFTTESSLVTERRFIKTETISRENLRMARNQDMGNLFM